MRNRLSLSALAVLALGLSLPATAQTYKFNTLYSFKNNSTNPKTPSALIIDGSGNLYGTSISGGLSTMARFSRSLRKVIAKRGP